MQSRIRRVVLRRVSRLGSSAESRASAPATPGEQAGDGLEEAELGSGRLESHSGGSTL